MSEGFWGVLFVVGLFALPVGWSYLSERNKAAAVIGDATGAAVDGGRWVIMKGIGVLLGVGGFYMLTSSPEGLKEVALGVFGLGYGAYLLFPGRPDEKSIWFW